MTGKGLDIRRWGRGSGVRVASETGLSSGNGFRYETSEVGTVMRHRVSPHNAWLFGAAVRLSGRHAPGGVPFG